MRKKIRKRNSTESKIYKPTKKGYKDEELKNNGSNDPAWYSQSAELLRDSASIPFSWPIGTPLNTSDKFLNDVVPGICTLELLPTVGTAANANAPVNVASSAIYSWVRHANSGHANYDSTDLMIYLLAMSNIYSLVVWMQRIYGYVSLYDQRNRYLPRGLAKADNIDFDDIRDNLANYRYFLNEFITKVASLAVPATMPIFSRLAFLYSHIYCEGPSVKDQMYMYVPFNRNWYKFGLDSSGAGELALSAMPATGTGLTHSFADIKTYANTLFDAIWEQEDFGIMSGDIIKAYDSNVIKLSPVPEIVQFTPVYDALVLHQFKNAKLPGNVEVSRIFQLNGILNQTILIDPNATALDKAITYQNCLAQKILSTDYDQPGPDVVIESTRLMPAYDSYKLWYICGTELPILCRMYAFDTNGALLATGFAGSERYDVSAGLSAAATQTTLLMQSMASNFKYHPELIVWGYSGTTISTGAGTRSWDIDNYAVLSNDDLAKMHESALLSLFAVPAIAKIQ